jgi:hypothetical protein
MLKIFLNFFIKEMFKNIKTCSNLDQCESFKYLEYI